VAPPGTLYERLPAASHGAYAPFVNRAGLLGYRCRVQKSADEIRAFPKDGVKKRLRFVGERIDIEAAAGEISWAALDMKSGALNLEPADSTGLVKIVRLAVRGLPPGRYEVESDSSKGRHNVTDILELDLPLKRGKAIHIRREFQYPGA
jgi:hypothetical protein